MAFKAALLLLVTSLLVTSTVSDHPLKWDIEDGVGAIVGGITGGALQYGGHGDDYADEPPPPPPPQKTPPPAPVKSPSPTPTSRGNAPAPAPQANAPAPAPQANAPAPPP
ncbi:formin-like protein 16 [Rosa chinensis]|uniref:formin-like protein 16 n=1 Tax=Rosa chinensis TaxID=74649 RepID=UPI001AD8C11E|nr:formin-like protein 16 [Rosa chinensis]